ncbi:RNA-guided endonuclease InsQ/TnpB family protein, partial [Anaerobutyricum hallii]|uniref:RNA-guided endonuclease InsQ/TnpB family protein n=1 Tax=Anaerobutyricum hallii TaxID=39488 RepID=UPI003993CDFC
TWKIMIRPDKDAVLCRYFEENTTAAKCMYNAANFYIRNTMTGIRKSPEERTAHETEVLHYVFTGIQKANAHSYEVYCKKRERYKKTGGMAGAVAMSKLKYKVVPYPTRDEWFLSYTVLDAIFKYTDHPTYRRMNSQVNQNAIKKTVKSWKSYFQLQKDYAIHPEKYKARPRIPGYIKQPAMTAAYTNQTAKFIRKDGHVYLRFVNHKPPVLIGKESLYADMTYVKTEVKPQYGGYSILLTFKEDIVLLEVPKSPKRILGIDVGVDNFCAVANNFGDAPFLIKGGAVKSMNRNFNKERARLLSEVTKGSDSTYSKKETKRLHTLSRKRETRLRDFFYKTAWYLVRYAKQQQAEVIVAGHNEDQKQNICIGRQNNQNFVAIPFCRFLDILRYTAAKAGIPVVLREESYTSRASLLDLDAIPAYKKGDTTNHTFSGKRVHRGIYKTDKGLFINADINGAGNILRKEYPYAYDGQNMKYLCETTEVVSYTDIYAGATSLCKKKYNQKKHTPGLGSCVNHRYKKETRMKYCILWGKSKYCYISQAKSA